jgi:hypothetical protein
LPRRHLSLAFAKTESPAGCNAEEDPPTGEATRRWQQVT